MSKDDPVIEAYKEIIKAQEQTINSLLAVIESQRQVISHIKYPPVSVSPNHFSPPYTVTC